ncbi:MAG: hypothetical protein MUQ30_14125 [Anaerolineae bacterium]|nr:hypothetical protein [Anaerolineae bacterium]
MFDEATSEFVRKDELRTRIITVIDAGIVITVIPEEVILEEIRYALDGNNRRVITDGKSFKMNVAEFGAHR